MKVSNPNKTYFASASKWFFINFLANDKKKFHCRSLSAHQLLTPGCNTKKSATTPTTFPRAISATSIKKPKDTEDGFDVYKIEQGINLDKNHCF